MFNSLLSSNITAVIVLTIATCLLFTVLIELIFARIFKVRGRNLLIVVLAQVVTNPIVVLVSNLLHYLGKAMSPFGIDVVGFICGLVIMEPLAFLVEGIMYKRFFEDYKFLHPLLLSFLLNLLSFVIGGTLMIIITSVFNA